MGSGSGYTKASDKSEAFVFFFDFFYQTLSGWKNKLDTANFEEAGTIK